MEKITSFIALILAIISTPFRIFDRLTETDDMKQKRLELYKISRISNTKK